MNLNIASFEHKSQWSSVNVLVKYMFIEIQAVYTTNSCNKKMYYYPYRAFGGRNKIILLPGLYVTNH